MTSKIIERHQTDAATPGVRGRITTRTYDIHTIRREIKAWDVLDDDQKINRLRGLDTIRETQTENIALDGLLEFIARALNPSASADAVTSHLAVGTGTDDPDAGNTELGEEVYRTAVGDADVDDSVTGADLLTSTMLSQIEANGHTITEVGLAGGPDDEPILTHALFDAGEEIVKNTEMVVVIDYVLEFRRPQ